MAEVKISVQRRTGKVIVERLSKNGKYWSVVHVERRLLEDADEHAAIERAKAWVQRTYA